MSKDQPAQGKVPAISDDFFLIVDRDNVALAAIIASYISSGDYYVPMFEFSRVTAAADNYEYQDEKLDQHTISRNRSRIFNTKIKNILKRIGKPKYIILGGLSTDQKSYLEFPSDYEVLEIDTEDEAMYILGAITNKHDLLPCRSDQIVSGLILAHQRGLGLKIDNNAALIEYEKINSDVIVIVEDIGKTSTIIGVNYALAIQAAISIVLEPSLNVQEIKHKIELWQEGDKNALNDLGAALYAPLADVNFGKHCYATFFTIGAPYGLLLNNSLPISHIHLRLNPDFFVFNCIYFEKSEKTNSAIVFSPLEFKDEETDYISTFLQSQNYYVRELVGKNASVYQLTNHINEFPFDILHICSHGGETSGYSVVKNFTDRSGHVHSIEFDEVVSFAPSHREELIPVTIKVLPRKFDGLLWGSIELKEKNYSHEVYLDAHEAMREVSKNERNRKAVVPNSCAIKCVDFYYQAIFDTIASMRSPFVFNNTCWSWLGIADSFLSSGCRAYIGTLWKVNNSIAKELAEQFYNVVFDKPLIDALYDSLDVTKGTNNENIYILWGLHFSTLTPASNINDPKLLVTGHLLRSLDQWKRKHETAPTSSKDLIYSLILWTANELAYNYTDESLKLVEFPGRSGI